MPIWSEPPSISFAAREEDHHDVAITPRNSIAGKKIDESFCAWTFEIAVRLVEVAELALERALAAERLHDGHAGDRLRELGRDGRDPRPHVGERDVRRASGTSG